MIVHVALAIPVSKTFSYSVPERLEAFVKRFSRVRVPFHNRTLTGFVVGIEEARGEGLKSIEDIVDLFPLIEGALANLCEWASCYYIAPLGIVLKYALPGSIQIENHVLINSLNDRSSALEGLSLKKAYKGYGKDLVFNYSFDGLIGLRDAFTGQVLVPGTGKPSPGAAAEKTLYVGSVDSRLDYYNACISERLSEGQNVLMLLPDYYSTGRFYRDALVQKFGGSVVWYGSQVKASTRMETYFKARSGGGFLILGNKSCIFLPVAHNSLIIVERQEEDEYRNEEGFKFNANTVALKRAEMENVPVVFGSAAPSLEMLKLEEEGRLTLKGGDTVSTGRYFVIKQEIGVIRKGVLPEGLADIIDEAARSRENIALYTPRKDYGSSIRCIECKEPFLCPFCFGLLSYQKQGNRLACSACGSGFDFLQECPKCGSSLIYAPHVGVEFIAEKLKDLFKNSHVVGVTGETVKEAAAALKTIRDDEHLIIVGSQVLSKLYNVRVDKLIFLGWEELLSIAGYRAEEKVYQIFSNLVDALRPKELCFFVDKNTAFSPARYFDSKQFYAEELKKRKAAEFPPYVRLFLLGVEKREEGAGLEVVDKICKILEQEGLMTRVTGPLKQKKKGGHRWKFILKGDEGLLYKPLLSLYDMPGVYIEPDPPNI